jgi:hypothetical protein
MQVYEAEKSVVTVTSLAAIAAVWALLAAPTLSFAQFAGERTVPAPAPSVSSASERDADAFMARNGYQLVPTMTKYGSVTGRSPSTLSISLNPGRWAIGVLNWNKSTCMLDVSYKDAGYTAGLEKHPSSLGPGFRFVPLNVESNLGGIHLTVVDAGSQPGNRSSSCGFELRFYRK